ncbi:MAG: hypothetical protein JWQ33_470 [Ramlibacter sp.]|nr:hypothetical protein [Ramlibacter sp.]
MLPTPLQSIVPRALFSLILLLFLSLAGAPAYAEFALAISPPRFELEAKAGQVLRQTVEITNGGARAGTYTLKTADWTYGMDGGVNFSDELTAGSCRPWVAIERRELTITPGKPYRFRFEVAPPAGAPAAECRFAILIEGQEEKTSSDGLVVPFNARVAVIVYVGVGGVEPELQIEGTSVEPIDGTPMPVLRVHNSGSAHGRLTGYLSGTDASNTPLDFVARTYPILPGETRSIPLMATRQGDPDAAVTVRFPATVKGRLEWGKNQSRSFEQRFAP